MNKLLILLSFSHYTQANDLNDQIQTALEKGIPRLICNLSATNEVKTPVLEGQNGILFAKSISPAPGSILASSSKQNPDYYFNWTRDAALTADALVEWLQITSSPEAKQALQHFLNDYIEFILKTQNNESHFGPGDPRVNVDGTVDLIQWSRPQRDGPALQSLTLLRLLDANPSPSLKEKISKILQTNLDYIVKNIDQKSFGPWEFSYGQHFYNRIVQLGALLEANRILGPSKERDLAAKHLAALLKQHWSPKRHYLMSSLDPLIDWRGDSTPVPGDGLDASTILGVLHAHLLGTEFTPADKKVQETARKLEKAFQHAYPINQGKTLGPAMGRYLGDDYFGGNPWFITTMAEGELYYRQAEKAKSNASRLELIQKGDAFLTTALKSIPESGMIAEQFDMKTGSPISSHDLSWGYAALITGAIARDKALPTKPGIHWNRIEWACKK
jgi:glucoamylase